MIEKCEKPAVFNHVKDDLYYIRGFDTDTYAYMGIDLRFEGYAFLHLEFVRFSRSILNSAIKDWEGIKSILRNNGVKQVGGTKMGEKKDHKRFMNFVKYFDFDSAYEHVTVTKRL